MSCHSTSQFLNKRLSWFYGVSKRVPGQVSKWVHHKSIRRHRDNQSKPKCTELYRSSCISPCRSWSTCIAENLDMLPERISTGWHENRAFPDAAPPRLSFSRTMRPPTQSDSPGMLQTILKSTGIFSTGSNLFDMFPSASVPVVQTVAVNITALSCCTVHHEVRSRLGTVLCRVVCCRASSRARRASASATTWWRDVSY